MPLSKPLPQYLVQRFVGWKATIYADNEVWHRRLAEVGQHPRAMVISCCDSRVQVTSLFGADPGEFFIHRNIANLVPPYEPDGDPHGTSAAVEYAVTHLKVAHLIVVGHSDCGGISGCEQMCSGNAPALEEKTSFLGRWLDIIRSGYEDVKHIEDADARQEALEKKAVEISLENLQGFPFVLDAVKAGGLSLHGLWTDIAEGRLESFVPGQGFTRVGPEGL
ncbi:carbonic anhydrase [Nereida ignava]|jgi:carbonic anhydrase|uniref:Carbonic anhydrase n=1 Tax=Nereida ignava TaxID=282199 RepID=A0A0U1NJY8_9RHOB|nr:carbonic anhydrase [Nereida ignava]CRK75027.1 Carbonic anhydrase 1 [Nereida ignava]SFJ03640.1 carbonic anhydrase [Nereida ignava DSM 16309]